MGPGAHPVSIQWLLGALSPPVLQPGTASHFTFNNLTPGCFYMVLYMKQPMTFMWYSTHPIKACPQLYTCGAVLILSRYILSCTCGAVLTLSRYVLSCVHLQKEDALVTMNIAHCKAQPSPGMVR